MEQRQCTTEHLDRSDASFVARFRARNRLNRDNGKLNMGADVLQASLMHGDRVNGLAVSASGERIERRGSAVLKAFSGVTKKLVATWQLRRTELQLLLGVIAVSAVYSFLY